MMLLFSGAAIVLFPRAAVFRAMSFRKMRVAIRPSTFKAAITKKAVFMLNASVMIPPARGPVPIPAKRTALKYPIHLPSFPSGVISPRYAWAMGK